MTIEQFLAQSDYDIRKTNDARWIDQKCTYDVLSIIADCILEYVEDDVSKEFTVSDIWHNDYTRDNVLEIFTKPDTESKKASNEYDKYFGQPIKLFGYSHILTVRKIGARYFYQVNNFELLEYIALRPTNALNFLFLYIQKVLSDSGHHEVPTIGFIAHVDTADFEARNIQPQIHENYNGEAIVLDEEGKFVLDPKDFPNLKNYVGQTLITTNGKTLLGADDKSGVTEIVTAGAYLLQHPEIKHGKIRVAFGPDEEIGRGADLFDVDHFACDFAYTMDGGPVGELEYESFNACRATVRIQGKNVHVLRRKSVV